MEQDLELLLKKFILLGDKMQHGDRHSGICGLEVVQK